MLQAFFVFFVIFVIVGGRLPPSFGHHHSYSIPLVHPETVTDATSGPVPSGGSSVDRFGAGP